MFMRKISIKSGKIKELYEQIKEYHKKDIGDLLTQKDSLEKELKKAALKMQKMKDKLSPMITKELGELEEFEYVANLDKDGDEVVAVIANQVDEYIEALRAKKAKQKVEDKKDK